MDQAPLEPRGATRDDLRDLLRKTFGFESFREGQLEGVEAALSGRDVIAVMPTGGGKSLIYQLPALLLPGATIVVSPLIALMKDQVDALEARGLPATFVNSTLSLGEQEARLEACRSGRMKLLYLAPERFRNERFRAAVQGLNVSLLAIDEAHCISQWGHDFRPDYRRLGEVAELLGRPPVIALTATATPEVREDVVRELALRDPLTLVLGFDRKNLFLSVHVASSDADKLVELERALDQAEGAAIVYVASRKSAEKVAGWLEARGRSAGIYHAGLDDTERERVQDHFMTGDLRLIVATNAFGMGIDKADIRAVVHYEFPKSLEAYYQEVGRAGRDGKPARALLLFSFADKRIQEFFIEGANPSPALVAQVYGALLRGKEDSVEASAAHIAAELGLKNDMAVGSALALLERAQVIQRDARPPRGSRVRPIRILQRVAPHALPVDAKLLERKLEADRKKLDAVVQFAYAKGCRKERLLAYFGDGRRLRTCEACDACVRRVASRRPLDEREAALATACLEMVKGLDGRFGLVRLGDLLSGGAVEVVVRYGLEDLPGVGALRHLGRRGALDWLDALLDAGYLEKVDIGREGAYVVRVSGSGRAALREGGALDVAPPGAASPTRAPSRAARDSAARRRVPSAGHTAARSGAPSGLFPRGAPAASATSGTSATSDASTASTGSDGGLAVAPPAEAPADRALLHALKEWRRGEAKRRAVPAYVVFHDAVLESIARTRPASTADLSTLPGIGPRKLEEYGEILLDVVRRGPARTR